MTSFARKVYNIVLKIPLGEVRTYKWVAKKAGSPRAYRAVGSILKKNPTPLIVPCHRVIKSDKELGDYAFGTKNKKWILDLEKRVILCLRSKE
jgi:methylated-DNA-[protein]-cysteine S-methyltransferase